MIFFDEHYATSVKTGSDLFPHVKETLEVLASHNIPLGIVTNKPSPFIAPLLQQLEIDKYFSLVLGGDDVKEKKPHPAPLYLTMGTFGVKKEELLFFCWGFSQRYYCSTRGTMPLRRFNLWL
ncbi:phosphoglycolate phosphatase family protein [Proteus penneri ATCC 35198]|nr:phosphoglycolate phosphatase family protein [Proteus penneri ATCC 35198]